MAVQAINLIGDLWFVFGDDTGNFFRLYESRIEYVASGNGSDRIIATENNPGLDPGTGGALTKQNPYYYTPDTVDAQGGDDRIIIDASGGTFLGGDGNDTISNNGPAVAGHVTMIYGDDASFDNTEGHGNDVISAGDGNEYIDGGGGTDLLLYENADSGVTVVLGDENGTYEIGTAHGGSGNDQLLRIENVGGSDFNDRITGNNVDNELSGGDGDDRIRGGDGDDLIFGGNGKDNLGGDNGDDEIHGGENNDRIRGGDGEDVMFGDNGNDNLGGGNDRDELYGGAGDDTLAGDQGSDLLVPGTGNNTVYGGTGNDTVDYSDSSVAIFGNLAGGAGPEDGFVRKGVPPGAIEVDTINSVENLIATQYDDSVFGSGKSNTIQGLGGNDAIAGLGSGDIIDGGPGNDLLFGNQGIDVILGGRGNDYINGGTEGDLLYGGAENDTIVGGPGSDFMVGESGDDRYVWGPNAFAPTSLDTVIGFVPLDDTLVFSGLVDDPATAQASDWLQANVQGNNTILTFDLDGTPGPATGPNYSQFVELVDYQIANNQLDLLQLVGGIEFV